MKPPDDIIRLRHLREAAEKAIHFSSGRIRQSLDDDELLRLGMLNLMTAYLGIVQAWRRSAMVASAVLIPVLIAVSLCLYLFVYQGAPHGGVRSPV